VLEPRGHELVLRVIEGLDASEGLLGWDWPVCAIASDHTVSCRGVHSGTPDTRDDAPSEPVRVRFLDSLTERVVLRDQACGLDRGRVRCGSIFGAQRTRAVPGMPSDVVALFGGAEQLVAHTSDGRTFVWGHNGAGQLGREASRPLERAVESAWRARGYAMAEHLTCLVGDAPPLACAGLSESLFRNPGTLGDGDGVVRAIPALTGVRAVAVSATSCAIDLEGQPWCWSIEPYQDAARGDGTRTSGRRFVEIDVAAIAARAVPL